MTEADDVSSISSNNPPVKCYNCVFVTASTQTDSGSNNNLLIPVAGGMGGVIAVLLIIIGVLCMKRRKKVEEELTEMEIARPVQR